MTITISPATFAQTGTHTYGQEGQYKCDVGTIELHVAGKTVTAKARRFEDGEITVAGFVGRYQTSNKAWPANVRFATNGEVCRAWFGRDDRSGRFNKLQGISYEPANWELVGYPKAYEAN